VLPGPDMENEQLQRVFREVFENDALEVHDALSPETLADWDSFHQVKLVIAVQEEFGVSFSTDEAVSLTSVAKFKQSLKAKGI
jgi:acyl carrier protein